MSILCSDKEGLVLRIRGNLARVLVSGQEYWLALPGRWRLKSKGANPLAAGDIVRLVNEKGQFKIIDIVPRRNAFVRKMAGPKPAPQIIAANLDLAVIIASISKPNTPFGLIDRLLVVAALGNVPAILLVNKIDLASDSILEKWKNIYKSAGVEILFSSALKGIGLERLYDIIKHKVVLLAGTSGVGKSTLANALDPDLKLKTAEISIATGKGKHTTSAAELYPFRGGGWIADTPGLRECAPWGLNKENIQDVFPEISRLKTSCRFNNCIHFRETDCAVRAAVGTIDLPEERYQTYIKLLSEIIQEK